MLVSIFVNPLQFGAGEDFDRYPRTLERDLELCAEEGVSVVFAPSRREMYPAEPQVTVDPGPVGRLLEGEFRPGFFGGVLTVVLKLFQLTRPDVAVFGEKDAQQLALIRQHGGRPGPRRGDRRRADPPRPGRPGHLQPQRVPVGRGSGPSALALPTRAGRRGRGGRGGPKAALAAAALLLDAAGASDPPVELDYLTLVDPADASPRPARTTPDRRCCSSRPGSAAPG